MIDMQGKVQFPGRPARSALECVWLDTALVFPVRIDITEKREVNWVIPEVSAIKLEVSPNYVPFFKGVLWVGMKKKREFDLGDHQPQTGEFWLSFKRASFFLSFIEATFGPAPRPYLI